MQSRGVNLGTTGRKAQARAWGMGAGMGAGVGAGVGAKQRWQHLN